MLSQKRTPTHKQTPQLAEQVKTIFRGFQLSVTGTRTKNKLQLHLTCSSEMEAGPQQTLLSFHSHYVTLSPAYFTSQHYLSLLIILCYLSLSIVHSSPPRQTSSSMQTYFRSLNVLYNLRIIGKSESDDKKFKDKEKNSLPSLCL